MRPRVFFIVAQILTLFLTLVISCGPKPIRPKSPLDTPENHFSRGMQEFEKGNSTAAIEEFNRAKALDPDYAEAYAGLGIVYAEQGDFKIAQDLANQALNKNKNSVDVRILRGRIVTKQHELDEKQDWLQDAVKEFKEAIKLEPRSTKAYFYMGLSYEKAFDFEQASSAFSKVIATKSSFATEADVEYAKIQKIQRAAPGTMVGAKVAFIDKIDRGELAVLLIEELKLMTLLEKKRPKKYDTDFKPPQDRNENLPFDSEGSPKIIDINKHWARNWIVEIVKAQVPGLEVSPDGMFYPDEKVTRAEFAMVMQSILILATGDQSLATKYIGQLSRFPDVNSSHFAYNAIALMTERGILSSNLIRGEFQPGGQISGADTLLAIRQFQNEFNMKF